MEGGFLRVNRLCWWYFGDTGGVMRMSMFTSHYTLGRSCHVWNGHGNLQQLLHVSVSISYLYSAWWKSDHAHSRCGCVLQQPIVCSLSQNLAPHWCSMKSEVFLEWTDYISTYIHAFPFISNVGVSIPENNQRLLHSTQLHTGWNCSTPQ